MLLEGRFLGLERFMKYSLVGVGTFLIDLALLFILTDTFLIPPVPAAGMSFILALSLNYLLSKRYVFGETQRSASSTYVLFIILGVLGLILVTSLMYTATHILEWHYLVSRVLIAGLVGVLNYLLNLYVNFRIPTAREPQEN